MIWHCLILLRLHSFLIKIDRSSKAQLSARTVFRWLSSRFHAPEMGYKSFHASVIR